MHGDDDDDDDEGEIEMLRVLRRIYMPQL